MMPGITTVATLLLIFAASQGQAAVVGWKKFDPTKSQDLDTLKIRLADPNCQGGTQFTVELALSAQSRAKGLMDRPKQLAPDRGMLFIYPDTAPREFWMKRTLIPLGIIFFDDEGKQVHATLMSVEKNPEHPARTYPSGSAARSALEISPTAFAKLKGKTHHLCMEVPPAKKAGR